MTTVYVLVPIRCAQLRKQVAIPLQILLVIDWHMFSDCAVLPLSTVQAAMGSNAVMAIEYFNHCIGNPHIYLTFDKFVRNGV